MSAHRKKHPSDFKTQYGLGLNQQNDEIVADFFCGGGGAGTGLGMGLGRAVTVAKTQLVHMCGNSVSPPRRWQHWFGQTIRGVQLRFKQ